MCKYLNLKFKMLFVVSVFVVGMPCIFVVKPVGGLVVVVHGLLSVGNFV